jgi:REP element-mobilizing transposase RayT
MARPLRVEFRGAFYHVINRGNGGEKIYISRRDREKFLEYLQKAVGRFGIKIHTYCLMTNHYHLLAETPQANLSQAIKWINVSYAGYFNRKHQRRGHLFQGRFKSILVDADEYLKPLSRYIHLNPIRAKIVQNLASYPWSSYPVFIGKIKAADWLEMNWLLSLFGKNRKEAAKNYQCFVEKVVIEKSENPTKYLAGGFILGSADFVNWVRETFLSERSEKKEIPQLRKLKPKRAPDMVVAAVSDEFGCRSHQVLQKGRKKNVPRDVAIYLARDLTGASCVDLGKYFGNISGAGITVRYNHMEKQIEHNRTLKKRIDRIKKKINKN